MRCSRLENENLLSELGDMLDPHVEQCEDCRERLRGYHQIARWIAQDRTAAQPPPDWKRRTLERVHGVPARRWRALMTAAAGLSAAAVLVLVLFHLRPPPTPPGHPQLAMQIVDDVGWRSPGAGSAAGHPSAHSGQIVRARALPAGARHFEIRVYRNARDLMARCPDAGPPTCREPGASLFGDDAAPSQNAAGTPSLLVWKIPSIGTYQVVLLVSQQAIAPPRGSFNDDLDAVATAGGQALDVETIDVR